MKAAVKAKMKRIFLAALAVCVTASGLSESSATVLTAGASSSKLSSEAAANEEAIGSMENDISALEQKQAELDEKLEATKGDITAEEERQATLREQILTVEETLHRLAASITELEADIASAEEEIAAKEAEVETKKREIVEGVDSLKKRLRVMYIAGGDSYTEILVGASDFYDMLMKLELVKRVANHDNDAIDQLIALKAQFEAEQEELNLKKQKLEADLEELNSRRTKQQAQKEKLEGLYSESEISLEKLAADKELYENNREQLEKEHEQFEEDLMKLFEERQAIAEKEEAEKKAKEEAKKKAKAEAKKKAEEEAKKKAEEEAAKKAAEEEAKKKAEEEAAKKQEEQSSEPDYDTPDYDTPSYYDPEPEPEPEPQPAAPSGVNPNAAYGYTEKSRFTWPVPGYYHISYGVGWRWGAYHKGIDIWSDGIRGRNIIAADAGEVILVSNTCTHDYAKNYSCGCGGGYGNYCIIDHGGGWWTLYGHSEKITVTQGQHVNKYDVLGTVGSTGHSTGPHLHFEVRQNGTALDPQGYV